MEKRSNEMCLDSLYKNVKMGSDSIVHLLGKVKGDALREEMTAELNRYESLARQIGEQIYDGGNTPKEENVMTKLSAKIGMSFGTMVDPSDSHIAQMMIEGATMGVTENTKLLREFENKDCSQKALSLTKQSIKLMEDSVETMKKYL